jgi:DNA-binding LytR/AlgR family response regulator
VAELAFIESRDRITIVHSVNGLQWTTTRSIKQWESEITGWIRIHRSFLINPQHIEHHNASEVGLRLQNNLEVLPISRSYKGVLDAVK